MPLSRWLREPPKYCRIECQRDAESVELRLRPMLDMGSDADDGPVDGVCGGSEASDSGGALDICIGGAAV